MKKSISSTLLLLFLWIPAVLAQSEPEPESDSNPLWQFTPSPPSIDVPMAEIPPDGGIFVPAGPPPCDVPADISLTGQPVIAEYITPELTALARNLENDPKRIYDYVHNYIRYVHYFGSKKGGLLTYLEGSGNDFDQCALLVALLRAAAQNSGASYAIKYQFGMMSMPYQSGDGVDLKHWLGLQVNHEIPWNDINSIYFKGGFPVYTNQYGQPNYFLLSAMRPPVVSSFFQVLQHRVWVKLVDGANTYYLDPAFKASVRVQGVDIRSAMQLNTTELLDQAGLGMVTGPGGIYVQNVNWNNLSIQLTAYTANLRSYLHNQHPNASVEEVVGGFVMPRSETTSFGCMPFRPFSTMRIMSDGSYRHIPIQEWDNIPASYMSSISITGAGIDITYRIPSLRARKLSLTFVGNPGSRAARISLDDVTSQTGTYSSTESAAIAMTVNHPTGSWNYNLNTVSPLDNRFRQHDKGPVTGNGPLYQRTAPGYAIVYAFDDPREQLARRQKVLDLLIANGTSPTSPAVLTEALNVMGLSWLQQEYLAVRILGRQNDVGAAWHHRIGRTGYESGSKLGYFVDVKLSYAASIPQSSNMNDDNTFRTFEVANFFSSAMEHGVIEQLQDNMSASTIKTLFLANQNGHKLLLGKQESASSVSAFLQAETVSPYTSSERTSLINEMNQAGVTMLLASGRSGLGDWQGYGYAVRKLLPEGDGSFGMILNGKYKGGFSGTMEPLDPIEVNAEAVHAPQAIDPGPPAWSRNFSIDPVNLLSGAFTLDSTDLVVGQAEPRGFTFARHYDSLQANSDVAHMGNGWNHNYNIKAIERSDPQAGLGKTTPQEMAAFLVAARVAYDVFHGTPDAQNSECKRWAVTALVAKWAVDQLTANAVNITIGSRPIQFIRQPDGTYTAPAGVTMTLTKPDGYRLQQRHGNTYNFDPAKHRIASIVDPHGKSMTFNYDSSDRLLTVQDCWPNPRTLTFTYSGTPQRLTAVSDGTGRAIAFGYATTYSPQGDLVSATDAEGKIWRYEYDGLHRITRTKDPTLPNPRIVVENEYDLDGRVMVQRSQGSTAKVWSFYVCGMETVERNPAGGRTTYLYDEKGRLIGVRDPNGNQSSTQYDGQDHAILRTTPKGEVIQYKYDANHNVTKIIDPQLNEATFLYDSQLRLAEQTDFRGKLTTYAYNTRHQVTTVTKPNVNNDPVMPSVVTFLYNDSTDGSLQSQTDEDGKATSFLYDGYGQMIRRTFPNADFETFLNNTRGDVDSHTDARSVVRHFTYNNRRQLTSMTVERPTGNLVTTRVYDDSGNLWKTIDPRGYTTVNTYSPTMKLLTTTLPPLPTVGSPVIVNTYDNRDWLGSTANPINQAVLYGYDAGQRLLTVTDPLGRVTTYGYDDNGQRTSVTTPLVEQEQTTYTDYNERGELTTTTDADGFDIEHGYDENGNPTTTLNRNGGTFVSTYYDDNRLWTSRTPLGKTTTRTYNKRGLVASITEPSGQQTTFTYDDRGRTQTKTDPMGLSTYTYDGNNNLRTHSENGKTITRTYDEFNRIKSYTDESNNTIGYDYDDNGNLTRLTYPDLKQVIYTYDSNNRLDTVTDWSGRVTVFTYDLAGRLTSITRPNGTVRRLTYDAAGQLKKIQELGPNGMPFVLFCLDYDGAGRVKSELFAPAPQPFTESGQSITHDADNRIATFNGVTVAHDDDGNMTSGPLHGNAAVTHTYDARNRLTGVAAGGTAPALSYIYDSEGNRTGITQGGLTTRFVVNPSAGLSQVLVRTKPNGKQTFYVYGHGLLYQVDEGGDPVCYHSDFRGSTVALTGGTGNVTDRMEYSSYGRLTHRIGTTDTPFLYNGRFGVQTDDNGLCYMRARYYSPFIRRFVNADPIGLAGGMNWYAYADGNPISFLDPFGLEPAAQSEGQHAIQSRAWWDFQMPTAVTRVMEAVIPGQAAWNRSYDQFRNGDILEGVGSVSQFIAEQALFYATLGASSAFRPAQNTLSAAAASTRTIQFASEANQTLAATQNGVLLGTVENGQVNLFRAVAGGIENHGQLVAQGLVGRGAQGFSLIVSEGRVVQMNLASQLNSPAANYNLNQAVGAEILRRIGPSSARVRGN